MNALLMNPVLKEKKSIWILVKDNSMLYGIW